MSVLIETLERRELLAAVDGTTPGLPRFDHVVIVMEENRSFSDIIGDSQEPYLNLLAQGGAVFTNAFAVVRGSQPNYLAIFSGSTYGVVGDAHYPKFDGPDLYSQLRSVGKSFAGYFQSMPSVGFDGDRAGEYARKHNPVTQFRDVPENVNRVFNSRSFPTAAGTNYSFLPTVSLVVPDLTNDMHDGSSEQGDAWLHDNLGAYASWASLHKSLLIVTWDEGSHSGSNQIPTIFYGAHVQAGNYSELINHYNVLRTVEAMYGLPGVGEAASLSPITDVWSDPTVPTGYSVTLDNSSATGISGGGIWYRSTAVNGYLGDDYLEDGNKGKGKKFLRYTPTLDHAGTYEVLMRWPAATNRAAHVPVDVTSVRGTDTVFVNERLHGGQWVSLGKYNFDPAERPPMVTIKTGGTARFVVADAVEFVEYGFDSSLSRPRAMTRKNPVKFASNLQVQPIVQTGNTPPPYADDVLVRSRGRDRAIRGFFV